MAERTTLCHERPTDLAADEGSFGFLLMEKRTLMEPLWQVWRHSFELTTLSDG